MKKNILLAVSLLMLNFAAFASSCTRSGNGYRVTVNCSGDCDGVDVCKIAQGIVNGLK